MGKLISCGKVNPASGCNHVVRGATEEEVLRNAAAHAKQDHGLEPTPELMEAVKKFIEEEGPAAGAAG